MKMMQRFISRIIVFIFIMALVGELVVRVFKLAPDIPHLYVDQTGIQRYIPGQSGYFTGVSSKWKVNDYGWLGVADLKKDSTIALIGDSFIENIMNPISCNQGSILRNYVKDYRFFEAGRSAVTFIEAMQITRLLDSTINPAMHLVYLQEGDFYESDAGQRYPDRMQINLETQTILNGELKAPGFKKLLYNCKLLYYLYLRVKQFNDSKAKPQHTLVLPVQSERRLEVVRQLLNYASKQYAPEKITLIFHPGTGPEIISMAEEAGFKCLLLQMEGTAANWTISKTDPHWSCYAHQQIARQISLRLPRLMKAAKAPKPQFIAFK